MAEEKTPPDSQDERSAEAADDDTDDTRSRRVSLVMPGLSRDQIKARMAAHWRNLVTHDDLRLTLLAVAIGAVAAWAAIAFRYLISGFQWLAFQEDLEKLFSTALALPWWHVLLAPAAGGLLIGLFIRYAMPEQRPLAVAEVMEAATHRGGHLSVRRAALASIANAASIGCGASVGREGPVVLIGAAIGSWVSRRLSLSRSAMLVLFGCGVASAVAASFNAPLAGALFALEVVIGHYRLRAFGPVVIASVTGTVMSRIHYGDFPAFIKPTYDIHSFWEFGAFGLLGIASAAAAMALMLGVMFAQRESAKMPMPVWARPAVGGLLVGAIAIAFPQVLGVGYEATDIALNPRAAGAMAFDVWLLIALVFAKLLASSISLGFGFGGGIFSPSLVLGAFLGAATGHIAGAAFPHLASDIGAYTLIGMAAVAAAVLGAPISTILIAFELTGDYKLTIGVMVAVVISSLLTQSIFGRSFFQWQLERRGLGDQPDHYERYLRETPVETLMHTDYVAIRQGAGLDEVRRRIVESSQGELFVVDPEERLVGTITYADLHGAAFAEGAAETEPAFERFMRRNPPVLAAGDSLEAASRAFSRSMDSHIAVVEDLEDMKLLGVVDQRDVMLAFQQAHHAAQAAEEGR
jgi:CIC family chloride channel protein